MYQVTWPYRYFPPGGCTHLPPLDVTFNKPFKAAIEWLATAHIQENLDAYVKGQLNASARRVLITKWVGQTWEEVSANRDMIIRSFQKTSVAVAVDGSEEYLIYIEGLEEYRVDDSEDEDEYTHEDPFISTDSDDWLYM